MNFKQIMSLVLTVLGIKAFAKNNEGRPFLTDEQKADLTTRYGEKFVSGFVADLAKYQEEGAAAAPLTAEERLELDASRRETARLKGEIDQLKKAEVDFRATIARLEKQPAAGGGQAVTLSEFEKAAVKAGVDLSMKHNRYLVDYMQGKVQAAYSGDSTIDTQELKREFGKYIDTNRMDILRGLFGTTDSTQYMSTIITDKTEVRASQANIIGTVLQQFVPEWTPSGAAKFTPLTIKNFKHKINVPIKPSDIMEDIIGYMYDEQASQLQSMPVVRYILSKLIFPKLDEEREYALATGRFVESQPDQSTGQYSASSPYASMDGYLTQLVDLFNHDADQSVTKKSGVRWLQQGVTIVVSGSGKNVRTTIDAAVKEVADRYPLYAKKKMNVHIDPVLADAYRREYLEEYKWLKNQDGTHKNDIDFSNFTFAECEGMRGTSCFFITPKENFKHLMSHNPQNVTMRFLESHYSVDVMAEWWEGTGFWLAEAIFAYISPSAAQDLAPESDDDDEGGDSTTTTDTPAGGGNTGTTAGEGSGDTTPTYAYYTYTPVADTAGKNPATEGWYERSGEEGSYVYTLTEDTEPGQDKTYYTRTTES